jgi:recombination protein RecA
MPFSERGGHSISQVLLVRSAGSQSPAKAHPRHEAKGLSSAISGLLQAQPVIPRCSEAQRKLRSVQITYAPVSRSVASPTQRRLTLGPYQRIEQGLKSADLILQAAGFGAIVLDLGGVAPEHVSRVELATCLSQTRRTSST